MNLGKDGLGLDSIEIVELVLECENRAGREDGIEELLDGGAVSIGRLIAHLARA